MHNPKISIIVPVYNKEKYLPDCIESLINQTYKNTEIILVDDGSTDKSAQICDEYANKDENIAIIHKSNGGPSSAWKAGFAVSTGDYICFVDSDDYVDTVMLEEMALELKQTSGEIVSSDYAIVKDDDTKTYVYQTLEPGEYLEEALNNDVIPNLIGNENRLIHVSRCMKLIERSLIANNIRHCDDKVRMGDDSTIILPVIIDAKRIYVMNHKAYYYYRYIDDSIVHKYDTNAFENNKLHYRTLKNMINEKFANDDVMRVRMLESLDKEEIFFLFHIVKNEVKLNAQNALGNLKQIRKDDLVKKCIDSAKISISGADNKLVYCVLKNPNFLTVSVLKLAFAIYYR